MNSSIISLLLSQDFSSRRMQGEIDTYFGALCSESGMPFSILSDMSVLDNSINRR